MCVCCVHVDVEHVDDDGSSELFVTSSTSNMNKWNVSPLKPNLVEPARLQILRRGDA